MKVKNASELVRKAYRDYAEYVNSYRAIPSAIDGLKLVQRRILSTLIKTGNPGALVATTSVSGDTIKYFHPHGSCDGSIVNMVNEYVPFIKGKGNFGSTKGLVPSDAAAARYTKVGLTEIGCKLTKLFKYCDSYVNENDYNEPVFLPMLPYCLLNGSQGIGVGCSAHIPAITKASLEGILKEVLLGKEVKTKAEIYSNGIVEVAKEEINNLNTIGICSVIEKAKITKVWSEYHNSFVITNVPECINLKNIRKEFNEEFSDGSMYIIDESSESTKIVVGRTKRIKKVTDAEIEKRLKKILSKKITYKCLVSHEGVVRHMSPVDMIKLSVKYSLSVYERYINDQIFLVNDEIVFETIKSSLANLLLRRETKENIMNELKITSDQYDKFTRKSISVLKSEVKDVEDMQKKLNNLQKSLTNLGKSYLSYLNI